MSKRNSFYYDPIRQGYDTNLWRTLSGAPGVTGGRLSVNHGSIVHYGDITKGEITFNVTVPDSPGGNDDRVFGLSAQNSANYIAFVIGSTLNCETVNGSNSTTSANIAWNSAWNAVNTVFKIRWEAGTAKFFINDTQVYAITDDSVPAGPMSLYIADDSNAGMTFGDIVAKGVQFFFLNPSTSDTSSYDGLLLSSQAITTTENVVLLVPKLFVPFSGVMAENNIISSDFLSDIIRSGARDTNKYDSIAVSENVLLSAA